MAKRTCTFTGEKGKCPEIAIGGFIHTELSECGFYCGFYCESHSRSAKLQWYIDIHNVRLVSLDEAIIHEVMDS
jgi:hypothetical protein